MSKPDTPKGTGGTLATKWSVAEIQRAIVAYTRNDDSIPNVAWGFFGNMECDLVQVNGSDRIHEFEIKRSWSDFMADFKKTRFHDDIRICRLTFVLPESFAGDRLKKFCADHYAEFKREFDFLFYAEGDRCRIVEGQWVTTSSWRQQYVFPEQFRTETYITPEMLETIRANDRAAPYRRKLFTEELAKLYRLGTIRLWHRTTPTEEAHSPLEEPKPADNGLPAGVRAATEEEVESGDAQWCKMCDRADCAFSHRDVLVHGCSRSVNKEALS